MPSTTLSELRAPRKLVENRISFAGPDSELSIYDTYQNASRVGLEAGELLCCGMIHGRKIMQATEQVFLPHESFIMAPGQHVEIDFPDASLKSPTTCLTIEIAREKVEAIAERLSDICVGLAQAWQGGPPVLHTSHTTETQNLLTRLTTLFTENHPDRDVMVELGVSELIVRMLRQQGREFLLNYSRKVPDACGISLSGKKSCPAAGYR